MARLLGIQPALREASLPVALDARHTRAAPHWAQNRLRNRCHRELLFEDEFMHHLLVTEIANWDRPLGQ